VSDGPQRGLADGSAALAAALIVHMEALEKIKRLSSPRYGKLTVASLYGPLCQIHDLCKRVNDYIENGYRTDAKEEDGPPQPGLLDL
jgi:hypothetical protein